MLKTMSPVFQILFLCWSFGALKAQVCTPLEGDPYCVCHTPDGGVIDLTSLSQEGSPRFQNVKDNYGQTYSYNPCYGIESNAQCSNDGRISAMCQEDTQGSVRSCGLTDTAEFRLESGSRMTIQYSAGVEGRISLVNLICDQESDEPQLLAYGDFGTPLTYSFDLRTKCACKNGCERAPRGGGRSNGNDKSGPIGITLIVLFIVAWPTYFITGAVILRVKFNKTGQDMIPQRSFWIALPGLIKDGFLFTFNPIIRIIKQRTGNDSTGTTEKKNLLP